jgi:dihydroxy-acid dehydratase
MADIDRCRAASRALQGGARQSDVHMEDVHRAGGIMAILGQLDRAGLIHATADRAHHDDGRGAGALGYFAHVTSESVHDFFCAAPGGVPTQVAFSQDRRWEELDLDRETGVIRSAEHAFSKDGGLAVLYGNIALDGCIVKTAGVDASILKPSPARPASSRARTRRWKAS